MPFSRDARRAILLALSLLSACAASDPSAPAVQSGTPITWSGNFLAGRFAMDQGDYNAAAKDLLLALDAAPNDRDLLLQAFFACLNAQRPEAVTLAERLPDNEVAELLLINAAAKAGHWHQAVERLRALPRDGVMQLLEPLLLAWANLGEGEPDQALATLRPYFDNQRYRPIAILNAAMIADIAGRTEEAARFYQQSIQNEAAESPRTALIVASWLDRTGQTDAARNVLARMAAAIPEASIALPDMAASLPRRPVARPLDGMAEAFTTFAAALRAQQAGDFATVMTRLALDVRPADATAVLIAADIQASEKHYPASLRLLDSAARANDPEVALVRMRRVGVLERMDKNDAAIREVEELGRDYPRSDLPDIELGDLLRASHRYTEAIAAYNRVIARERKPTANDWVLWYGRGICYERTGQWTRAEADFDHALQLSPDQPSVLNYLGYAWADMGRNLDRAREMIQKAAARRPNDGAITDSLGWVMYRQGNVAEATKLLERAVGMEPEDPTITAHLGDAYWASGRRIEAQYQWRRALTLNPDPEDAAKLEAKIKAHPFGAVASGQ